MIDLTCALAAVLLITSNILYAVVFAKYVKRPHHDYQLWTDMDPAYIRAEFEFQDSLRPLELGAGLLNAIAWFALVPVFIQLAWILSKGGRRFIGVHAAIGAMVVGGSLAEFLARLFSLGTSNVAEWLASDFNLDNWLCSDCNDGVGWRTLQVSYLIAEGITIWVDALEWLALFGILVGVAFSAYGEPDFPKRWTIYGVFIAVLCLFDFVCNVLRFDDWVTFSIVASAITMVNRLLLLPIWLFLLAGHLPLAKEAFLAANGKPSAEAPSAPIRPPESSTGVL